MLNKKSHQIALIGAGTAGAACARALTLAGCTVQVFDKSCGPGGRLATRRVVWVGALDCILRNDTRPGREHVPGQVHWAAHARAGWSRRHLEQPAPWVQAQLQAALAEVLGRPVDWLHGSVHRWRYAMPQAQRSAPGEAVWWDASQGLGVCGDALGGGGVEGAWSSAQALAEAMLQSVSQVPGVCAEITAPSPAGRGPVQRLILEGVNTSAAGHPA